jgi:uncharacterized cupin superfamily protein
MSRRPPVLAAAAAEATLEPDPLDPEQIVAGSPVTSALVLATSAGGVESGIWRCTPGTFRDVEQEETFVVLEGRATLEFEGGRRELAAGDVCVLTPGARTVWTVHETLLKGYSLAPGTESEPVS